MFSGYPKLFEIVRLQHIRIFEDMGTPDRLLKSIVILLPVKFKPEAGHTNSVQFSWSRWRDQHWYWLNQNARWVELYPMLTKAVPVESNEFWLFGHCYYKSIGGGSQTCAQKAISAIIHNKMDTILVLKMPRSDALYYCPHHPRWFPGRNPVLVECHCRKPKPGMLLDAARDFNMIYRKSWFCGRYRARYCCR